MTLGVLGAVAALGIALAERAASRFGPRWRRPRP